MLAMGRNARLAIFLAILAEFAIAYKEIIGVHCQFELFNGTCGPSEIVIMQSATYGRMQMGRCVVGNYGYIGCSVDVRDTLDHHCSGRQKCNFPVSTLREIVNPCPSDLTSYLRTVYYCVKILSLQAGQCRNGFVKSSPSTSDVRYISGDFDRYGELASRRCPVEIRTMPGQRVNVTLQNFAHASKRRLRHHGRCPYQIYISEPHTGPTNRSVCASERNAHLFTSQSNTIRIFFTTTKQIGSSPQFLVHFQVLGCPLPGHSGKTTTTVSASGEEATVVCNITRQVWKLSCRDNQWVDVSPAGHNCSPPAIHDSATKRNTLLPLIKYKSAGLMLAVISGVFIGVISGLALLVSILIFKRYRVTSHGGHDQGQLKDESVYCSTRIPVRPVSSGGNWNEGVASGGGTWGEAGVVEAGVVEPRLDCVGKEHQHHDPAYIHMIELRCEAHHGTRTRTKSQTTPAIRQFSSFKPAKTGSTCLLPPPPLPQHHTNLSDDSRENCQIQGQALTLERYRYPTDKSSGVTTERRLSSGCLITGIDSF